MIFVCNGSILILEMFNTGIEVVSGIPIKNKQGTMKKKNTSVAMSNSCNPEAFIASKKSRLPIYKGNTVYLKNSSSFEIELWNPTQKPVGVQIRINGQQMSSSILVLRPGMRYFLDRFLDEAKKLVYDTYMADNSAAGKAATASNGLVEVTFHREREAQPYVAPLKLTDWTYPYNQTIPIPANPFSTPTVPWYTNIGGTCGTTFTSAGLYNSPLNEENLNNQFFCSTDSLNDMSFTASSAIGNAQAYKDMSANSAKTRSGSVLRSAAPAPTFETGRVEKGSYSDQNFGVYNGEFETWQFHSVSWQIQPESLKAEAMRNYCGCGKRLKTTFKFCPSCGKSC